MGALIQFPTAAGDGRMDGDEMQLRAMCVTRMGKVVRDLERLLDRIDHSLADLPQNASRRKLQEQGQEIRVLLPVARKLLSEI